jgi:hypothetical protein
MTEVPPPQNPQPRQTQPGAFWRRLLSDSFLGLLSGLVGGVFSATVLVAFSDDFRDWAIRLRTINPAGHVLLVYDPRQPAGSEPTVYNVYGVRENDNFEGVFGKQNPDGTTNSDVSFRFKGFARDGQMYFNYAPSHNERFGAGQFQSINRLEGDLYYGLMLAQICDETGSAANSVQRIVVGVLARSDQQKKADKAAAAVIVPEMKPIYAVDLSHRDCIATLKGKKVPTP